MRIAIGVDYDGTRYVGWQRQHHGATVQGELERVLSRIADETVDVVCAGRTDTGVHALGQVAHFDTGAERPSRGWLLGANSALPPDISVAWVRRVDDPSFHARFSATSRRYVYLILNRAVRSAFCANRGFVVREPLDVDTMQAGAAALVGEHDFSAFRAAGCQSRTPWREVTRCEVRRCGDWVVIDVSANAFLQHMVRNMAGLLVTIGRGDLPPQAAGELLRGRDRTAAPFAAPAHGLTLVSVSYPEAFGLPRGPSLDVLPLPSRFFD